MKALTIKEPWASLIINKYKEYEFRSWKTNYRGKILIHAGLTLEHDTVERFSCYNLNYKMGYIIGEATLVDCIAVDDKFNNELRIKNPVVYAKSNHIEDYAWKLENIKKYEKPIPAKGKLGLWNYEVNKMHEMRLNNNPFNLIKSGSKTIEMRLNDEKRKLVKIGDTIKFVNRNTGEYIITTVVNLHHYENFDELYKHFNKVSLGYKDNEVASPKDMEKYYSIEEQKKYGVLGIELSLM